MSNTTTPLPGFKLQAPGGAPAQTVSFGQAFLPGAVPSGSALAMVAGGVTKPVQMEVRTRHPDGSVAFAQVVLPQPALAAGQTLDAAFVLGSASTAPAVDLAAVLSKHTASVALTFADGARSSVDVIAAARKAIADGTASFWQKGPYATQARVEVPVSGSLYLSFDLTADASGNLKLDAHFNNDRAMGGAGGTATYAASITLDGRTASQPQLTQYQYQNWNKVLESKPASFVNVRHDIGYVERTGLLQNFDQDRGKFFTGQVGANAGRLDDADWGKPFAPHDIQQYMPGVGGRPDIGPTTGANANWVLTQDALAARYALDQAGATDGIPWHFRDVATGTWMTADRRPGLWTDPRGGNGPPGGLTQQADLGNNGWTPQRAHAPDGSYIPYLLTGERAFLDELNAEASWAVMDTWPAQRGATDDIVAQYQEVRGGAWSLRTIQEAAWVNADGSPEKSYFAGVAADNWKWLVSMIPEWTAYQGEAYGHIPMEMGEPQFAPWQQDYFASTTAQAVINGNADAKTFLEWQSNFLSQRFLNADRGMDPRTGVSYQLLVKDAQGNPLKTWGEINKATIAAGWAGDYWPNTDYTELALMSLAGTMTALGDSKGGLAAMKAYGLLAASDAPFLTSDSQFQIAPRLADGRLLTWSNITVSRSAAGTTNTVQGPDAAANQLLYAGAGNDTLVGGRGVNLFYGGGGTDTFQGGAGRDYMFGGTGTATFKGGAGANYMEGGKGADTFVVTVSDAAQDTIAGFRSGVDTIRVSGATDADVARWISGATAKGGDTVLSLSAGHGLTLKGFTPSQVKASMFTGAVPKTGDNWPSITLGTGADTVTLGISQDAYKGDAQYIVTLDGVQLGGTQTAAAPHATGQSQLVHVKGDFTHGSRQLGVKFLNDAWGGTAATDRNLYVDSVVANQTDTRQSAALMSNGTRSFAVGSNAPPSDVILGTGADTVLLGISEDAYNGHAQYVVTLDGVQLGGTQTASASHAAGQSQRVQVKGDFTHGPRQLGVKFLNDAWGGTAATDRNLYVDSVVANGTDTRQSAALMSSGTRSFAVGSNASTADVILGTGADAVVLAISEDAYNGHAQYAVTLDGVRVGEVQTASASHAAGQSQFVQVKGDFTHGPRQLGVEFLNDYWEGTDATDRNLYVDSVVVNGADTRQSATMLSNGTHGFTVGSDAPVAARAALVADVSADVAGAMAFVAGADAGEPDAALSGLDLADEATLAAAVQTASTAATASGALEPADVDGPGAFALAVPTSSASAMLPVLQTTPS